MERMQSMRLSVIIPVYNVEQYLQRCIESVCGQTLQDLEIILVDDGSTDSSGDICDRYSERDDRIVVIHQGNEGLVSARQTALRAARGDFIAWVDSDDWIEPDYLLRMAELQDRTGVDVVAADLYLDRYHDSTKLKNNIPEGVYRSEEILPDLIYSGTFFECGVHPNLVTKLIRKEIFDKLQMRVDPRIRMGEDAAFVYPCIVAANKIAITDICGYHYIQRQDSITKTGRADELDRLQLLLTHLERTFKAANVWEIMRPQLIQYEKYLLLIRQLPVLDRKVLLPYGGIPYHSRVVIYGAGLAGQQIYRYLTGNCLAEISLWVDQNSTYYQENGLPIETPPAIRDLDGQYDYVLIANMSEPTANSIREYLLSLCVPDEKIRWLSDDFLHI